MPTTASQPRQPPPLPRWLMKFLVACTLAYTVVLVVATHYPKPGELLEYSPIKADKTLHFIAYGIQGLLVGTTLVAAGRGRIRSLALAMLALAAFAAVDEATQPLFGRYADPLDWVYDCIGIAAGLMLTHLAAYVLHAREILAAASLDPLTNALNRLGFERQFERRITADLAAGKPVAAVLCDLDHFKEVNDAHGHATGDALLQAAVSRMRLALRASDPIVRLGGDEFVVPLPGLGNETARAVAERIRNSLATEPFGLGSLSLPLTASLGVACSRSSDTWASLLARADARMYAAKAAGRNRCVASDPA